MNSDQDKNQSDDTREDRPQNSETREHLNFNELTPDQLEDQALDSVLKTLGQSEIDGPRFADRVLARIVKSSSSRRAQTLPYIQPVFDKLDRDIEVSAEEVIPEIGPAVSIWQTPTIVRLLILAAVCLPLMVAAIWMNNPDTGVAVDESVHSNNQNLNGHLAASDSSSDEHWTEAPYVSTPEEEDAFKKLEKSLTAMTVEETVREESVRPFIAPPYQWPLRNEKLDRQDALAKQMEDEQLQKELLGLDHEGPELLDEKLDYQLVFKFSPFGRGKVALNGETVPFPFTNSEAQLIIQQTGHNMKRMVRYLYPAMGRSLHGEVQIVTPAEQLTFSFETIDQMRTAFVQAGNQLAKQTFKERKENEEDNRLPANGGTTWRETEFVISELYDSTKSLLYDHVKNAQALEDDLVRIEQGLFSASFFRSAKRHERKFTTIGKDELTNFLKLQRLELPETSMVYTDDTRFQQFSEATLKNSLIDNATPINLFRNMKEFKSNQEAVRRQTAKNRGRNNAALASTRTQLVQLRTQLGLLDPQSANSLVVRQQIDQLARQANKDDGVKAIKPIEPLLTHLGNRPDLAGLPLVMGDDCHLEDQEAEVMTSVSEVVGPNLARFAPFGTRNLGAHDEVRSKMVGVFAANALTANKRDGKAYSTLDQMLQVEPNDVRLKLIELYRGSTSEEAKDVLVRHVKYDLDPAVRKAATLALDDIDPDEYREEILAGFEYPWPEVAKHCAEALVRLNDTKAVPYLVELLGKSDPRLPAENNTGDLYRKQLVSINHMKNCFLCHSDSQSVSDSGRGMTPTWGKPLPRLYYHQQSSSETFVRADTTYLHQDFSVTQKMEKAKPWPVDQRTDYVVQRKILSEKEAASFVDEFEFNIRDYRLPISQAISQLTGVKAPKDHSYEGWQELLKNEELKRGRNRVPGRNSNP